MPDRIETLTQRMATSRAGLLREADSVSPKGWKTKPNEQSWSAAELIAHLVMVERAVLGKADRVAQKAPKPVSFLKRLHLPMALVEARIVKRKAPVPVTPEMIRGKEEMLAELREVRERTIAFLAETKSRDLGEYYWPHPALGMLNTYEWMRFLYAHEVRHTKQLKEIKESMLKSAANKQ